MPLEKFTFESEGKKRPLPDVYIEQLQKGYLHFWKTVWKPNMPSSSTKNSQIRLWDYIS